MVPYIATAGAKHVLVMDELFVCSAFLVENEPFSVHIFIILSFKHLGQKVLTSPNSHMSNLFTYTVYVLWSLCQQGLID